MDMEWIYLEREQPKEVGIYLVCYIIDDVMVTKTLPWFYFLETVSEDHDKVVSKKIWSFRGFDVIAWMPFPPPVR